MFSQGQSRLQGDKVQETKHRLLGQSREVAVGRMAPKAPGPHQAGALCSLLLPSDSFYGYKVSRLLLQVYGDHVRTHLLLAAKIPQFHVCVSPTQSSESLGSWSRRG